MARTSGLVWLILVLLCAECQSNLAPVFTQVMNNLALSEATPVGTVVYTLEGYDPEDSEVSFGLVGTDNFKVDPKTGEVTIIKALDREEHDTLSFLVSIKDVVNSTGDSQNDNLVEVPVTVIVLDENDNAPQFEQVPYETEVYENATVGTTIFDKILVTDKDTVGENLDIMCSSQSQNPDGCSKFIFKIIESSQNVLKAAVILNDTLDYNKRMIYHLEINATDGTHSTATSFEVRVKDVQNSPPVFQGSLAAVIEENSPIGTLVLKVQARDGDTGEPRKIVYELLTNPMDYFLLDPKTGELRTAKPLDKEALNDATGLITLDIRARELVDGIPQSDNLTMATTQASITIRDVNDSPPEFNKKEYFVSLVENTAPGTPLALEMNVSDKDVGINSIFSLRLDDVSGVFEVEPDVVRGSSQVNIRVGNRTLDYENPNQRKFIVLVIAEETETDPKLSSTATITISVIDANDNRPTFEEESYSASVSESAEPGQFITSIIAKDIDSGSYGDAGIRYTLSGTGSELFHVDPVTGVITVADCHATLTHHNRKRRELLMPEELQIENGNNKNINVMANGETGIVQIEVSTEPEVTYTVVSDESPTDDHTEMDNNLDYEGTDKDMTKLPCLDYETQPVYFLSYKATDDNGKGQTSVVSLRISIIDANDSPPVCESPLYRASIDEGALTFDPPLVVKARDVDTVSDITYSIIGNENVGKFFEIDKRSGQINIRPDAELDVNHLKSDFISFSVEANDGVFSAICGVNITIRDVNNHAPQFLRDHYVASVAENTGIGTSVEMLKAIDLDTGINAEIRYRIQQGSFDDFRIDDTSGLVSVSRKLDYDRRNTYQIEVLATDLGTPSLSGTTTLTVSVTNSNDKDPFFTPSTQRAEVREDAVIGTIIHNLVAIDPDVESNDVLQYSATEPITAVDKDGKEIEDVENFKDVFTVDRSGKVIVNQKLDRNLFAVIRITVLVIDSTASTTQQGKGLLIISIIDVNEVPPKFAQPWSEDDPILKYQIPEEQPIGTILTTLQASDEDSTIDAFNITENPFFTINTTTGVIATKSRIDYEHTKEIRFFATVTDTGIPQLTSTAEVIVDVVNINDNGPYFLKPEYDFTVLENSPSGTLVGKVEAKDDDLGNYGDIFYTLVGKDSKNFLMAPDTGILTVANNTFLDRETVSMITLSVVATDKAPMNPKTTTATINIKVLDINDNAPHFTQKEYTSSVAENAALHPPATLLQVTAEDADDSIFGEVRYFIISGNDEELFQLDPKSGILYPGKSLLGKKGKYILEVEARDGVGAGPHKEQATVIIDVLGINQYRPVFLMPALSNATVELPGDIVEANYLVMTVKAMDNDTGENGKISYHLQVNNKNIQESEAFTIDEHSGELRTRKQLNRNIRSTYDLILVARDQGTPSYFETLRFLSIILVDVNENRPEFSDASNPYKITVLENSPPDIRVGRVQAYTKSKNKKDIFYYMLLGNEDGAFYLDKSTGDIYTNKSLDRESIPSYNLYILASNKVDLHISDIERATFSIKSLERDSSVAKVWVTVLDVNDNPPIFEKSVYYAGVNSKSSINEIVILVNATDRDFGANASLEYIITASNLYKFGSSKSTGSIVPSPFAISKDGRLTTATFMAEYNQDRFELDIIAKEVEPPERFAKTKVYVWIFDSEQLIRVILSRPPSEVHQERDEIVAELGNATHKHIVVDEIRYHVDAVGRIRMDWCDLFFHAVDLSTNEITPVNNILKVIDANYDYLKDYYAGFAIENVVPAYATIEEDEFDMALAGLVALIIVLFVGAISFIVLCCCLKQCNLSIPLEKTRKEALIKKQIIEDLNTTENPLWMEQKLKLYEEQELTMQVFSEPEFCSTSDPSPTTLDRRDSFGTSHAGDNTYATIQPRNGSQIADVADYATLRDNRVPSMYEFTGSTFQAPVREQDDFVTELI
ncbi:cadherin-87A [Hermetia illucens]|nr:cadherin-87A [Hermetia illucens]